MRKIHRDSLDRFERDLIASGVPNLRRKTWIEVARMSLEEFSTQRSSLIIHQMSPGQLEVRCSGKNELYLFLAECVKDEIDLRIPTPPVRIEE